MPEGLQPSLKLFHRDPHCAITYMYRPQPPLANLSVILGPTTLRCLAPLPDGKEYLGMIHGDASQRMGLEVRAHPSISACGCAQVITRAS